MDKEEFMVLINSFQHLLHNSTFNFLYIVRINALLQTFFQLFIISTVKDSM